MRGTPALPQDAQRALLAHIKTPTGIRLVYPVKYVTETPPYPTHAQQRLSVMISSVLAMLVLLAMVLLVISAL